MVDTGLETRHNGRIDKSRFVGGKHESIPRRIAHGAGETLDMPCHVEDTPEYFVYVVKDCPCRLRKRELKAPCCYVTMGALMEAMRWPTGVEHNVTEFNCIKTGHNACRYRVEKKAVERLQAPFASWSYGTKS